MCDPVQALEYLLWASVSLELSIPLMTAKYLPWIVTLYCAVCHCYYDNKAAAQAEVKDASSCKNTYTHAIAVTPTGHSHLKVMLTNCFCCDCCRDNRLRLNDFLMTLICLIQFTG